MFSVTRLSAQLQQTTWQQALLSLEEDETALQTWANKFEVFAAQQGGLDMKYLKDRYDRGVQKVSELMNDRHVFATYSSAVLAHADIVQKQASLGSSALTLMVIDCTLWPNRALTIDEAVSLGQAVAGGALMSMKSHSTLPTAVTKETAARLASNAPRIPDLILEKYTGAHLSKLHELESRINANAAVVAALGNHQAATSTSEGTTATSPQRTLASPDWDAGYSPVNFARTVDMDSIPLTDFESEARNAADQIPWLLAKDTDTVSLVTGTEKELMSLSDVMCNVTRTRGVTEVRLADYDLQAMTKVDANGATLPRAFRYTLEMKTKVHAFLPKQLADGADPKDLRSSVLGAFWLPNLEKIPKSPTASIIWEAAKHFGDHSNTMFSFYDDLLFFWKFSCSSAGMDANPKVVRISKYRYNTGPRAGIWGFKINDSERVRESMITEALRKRRAEASAQQAAQDAPMEDLTAENGGEGEEEELEQDDEQVEDPE
ncbi:Modification methylase ScrFIA [Durusdinium trenchii]|uniref:Modification methylase ScrFIA n=1 Tax=Durusdinium trenchii TaxID=1381693 RepID=A0ABP0NBP8_9DINO